MSQIQTGTCAVTNGNVRVIASAGNDWTAAVVGGLFSVNGDAGAAYIVASVTPPGSSMSGNWEITTTGNYSGTTNATALYQISIDFTPNFNLPLIDSGDIDTAALVSRGFALVDTELQVLSVEQARVAALLIAHGIT